MDAFDMTQVLKPLGGHPIPRQLTLDEIAIAERLEDWI